MILIVSGCKVFRKASTEASKDSVKILIDSQKDSAIVTVDSLKKQQSSGYETEPRSRIDHKDTTVFSSPLKKYRTLLIKGLEEVWHNSGDIDRVSNVEYSVLIINSSTADTIKTQYIDVYWDEGKPSSSASIFYQFTWSPKEDFVILPVENWASAPGTEGRLAVNLNKYYTWDKADYSQESNYWIKDFVVVGQYRDESGISSVVAFNGKTGKNSGIRWSNEKTGYEIESVSRDTLRIKSDSSYSNSNFKSEELIIPFKDIDKWIH
jgi:hypothetical protein